MGDPEAQAAAEDAVAQMFEEAAPENSPNDPPEERVVEPVVEGDESEPDEVDEEPEDTPEDEPTDEIDGEETVEIEVDGEVLEVPAKYKDHFMRAKDYTEKTQTLSTQRKEIEVQQGTVDLRAKQYEFAQSVQPDVMKAQQQHDLAEQYRQHLKQNVDTLSATDITKLQMAISEAERERDGIVSGLQAQEAEFQQASEQTKTELRNKGTEILMQKIPGWGEAQQKQVREFALSSGFSEAELASVMDPRQVETLWKASQYDALKAGSAPAVKTVQKAPTIKPKARKSMSKETQDKLNLRKKLKGSASAQDKASAIGDNLAKRFGM